jgi:hypothetical protein
MNKIDIMNGILDAHELNFSQVVAANMVREIWEDSKRHKDDSEVNHRIVEVVKEGKITEVRCAIAELFFLKVKAECLSSILGISHLGILRAVNRFVHLTNIS